MRNSESNNSTVLDTSVFSTSEAIEVQKLQNEHEERTVWRRDMIMTTAKAISLTAISISCAICLYLVIKQQNNELLIEIAQMAMYIISFCAGRLTSRQDKGLIDLHTSQK